MATVLTEDKVGEISHKMAEFFNPLGFECHPFLVGWYNAQVGQKFHLPYSESALAFIVISQPSMFEKAFVPFLTQHWTKEKVRDPIDECMLHYFGEIQQKFRPEVVHCLHDFQLAANRRPKILVQTAGHVAGAVRFYHGKHFPEIADENLYPVCHHPRWGGWFALRGVLLFENITCPSLTQKEPSSPLSSEEAQNMLVMYNDHWQDWKWRDVGGPDYRYSPLQIRYFETPPAERETVIAEILQQQQRAEGESK